MRFEIVGQEMQAVIAHLDPGEEVRAEAGAMLFMTSGIRMDTRMQGGLLGGLKRALVGESLFLPHFRCEGPPGRVAFAAPYPGEVRRLDLAADAWLCQRDSFLFGTMGLEMSIAFTRKFGAGVFGGEGFILQRIAGSGVVFIHGGGNFIDFELAPGAEISVDTGCIVAFQETVHYNIRFVGGFRNTLFGGEGLFVATLAGPGRAILQTLPFSRLAGRIRGAGTEGSSSLGGVGGTLGDIGRLFGGGD